jgi:alpha-methylacyl-CoA racemase
LAEVFASRFRERSRAEWTTVFEGTDACVAPVLCLGEAATHAHNVERGTFIEVGGVVQPAPAPRFGRTMVDRPNAPPEFGADSDALLGELGLDAPTIANLRATGVIA